MCTSSDHWISPLVFGKSDQWFTINYHHVQTGSINRKWLKHLSAEIFDPNIMYCLDMQYESLISGLRHK